MLVTLVNDLLDLSRLQAGRMQIKVQPFSVAELIDSICTENTRPRWITLIALGVCIVRLPAPGFRLPARACSL